MVPNAVYLSTINHVTNSQVSKLNIKRHVGIANR
jgi:hypothetical protein